MEPRKGHRLFSSRFNHPSTTMKGDIETEKQFVTCGNKILNYRNKILICGDKRVSCYNGIVSCLGQYLQLSCYNKIVSCGNKIVICENKIVSCGNKITPCSNQIVSCGNKERKIVYVPSWATQLLLIKQVWFLN